MTDAFDLETPTQRRLVIGALLGYGVLFAVELATGNQLAAAAADLWLALFVVPASAFVIRRETAAGSVDRVTVLTAVAFAIAGLTIGYEGLATLELVPSVAAVEFAGTVALLLALVLYLSQGR